MALQVVSAAGIGQTYWKYTVFVKRKRPSRLHIICISTCLAKLFAVTDQLIPGETL